MKIGNKTTGFTLVELLIAMLLGLLLVTGVVTVFLEGKRNYTQDDEIARMQENGRYALRLMSRELGMAGHMGGVTTPSDIDGGSVTGGDCGSGGDWALTGGSIIEVVNDLAANPATYFSCIASGDVTAGTDMVAIKRVSDAPVVFDGAWENGVTAFNDDRYYLRVDGQGNSSFQVSLAKGSTHTSNQTDIIGTDTDINVWEYYVSLFYVGEDGTNGQPSLCKRELNGSGEISSELCLVNGIEDMQIELGIDTDGDGVADRFVADSTEPPVTSATDMDDVVAFRVHILARTLNEINNFDAATRTYKLGSTTSSTVTTNDRYFRAVFTTTVPVRNRVGI